MGRRRKGWKVTSSSRQSRSGRRRAALVLALLVLTAACNKGSGSGEESSATPGSVPPATVSTAAATTTTIAVTTTETQVPPAEPIVIDLEADPAGRELLSGATSDMLGSVSFRFRRDIQLAVDLEPLSQASQTIEGTALEGIVTPQGVYAKGDMGMFIGEDSFDDPRAAEVLAARADELYYEVIDSRGVLFAHSPVLGIVDDLLGTQASVVDAHQPLVEGWIRLDGIPEMLLTDAMTLAGGAMPTDPRELLELISRGRRTGTPTPDRPIDDTVTRVDVVVALPDLLAVNGDEDVNTYINLLHPLDAFSSDSLDALGQALSDSEATVSVWLDDNDRIIRVEYELGGEALVTALKDPDLVDALDSLGFEDHVTYTFDDFGDPALRVEPPDHFVPVSASEFLR